MSLKTLLWDNYQGWELVSIRIILILINYKPTVLNKRKALNVNFKLLSGCFDLLLDAEKCKHGMEMGGLTVGMGVGGGMYFGVGTPSMTPLMTPWSNQNTPGYGSSVWSPGQGKHSLRLIVLQYFIIISDFYFLMLF